MPAKTPTPANIPANIPAHISVDIFSDIICPWCFIGKKRLEQAAMLHGGVALKINWRSFLLNPAMPRDGMDRQDYIQAKFGPAGASFYESIASVGKEIGIDFNFAAITKTPDSRPAHALVLAAGDKADAAIEALFKAYFIDGLDIGDEAVLNNIAAQHGLDYPPPAETLSRITEDLAEIARLNIQAVPFFIIANEWALSGAQPPLTFQPLFDAAIAKNQATRTH